MRDIKRRGRQSRREETRPSPFARDVERLIEIARPGAIDRHEREVLEIDQRGIVDAWRRHPSLDLGENGRRVAIGQPFGCRDGAKVVGEGERGIAHDGTSRRIMRSIVATSREGSARSQEHVGVGPCEALAWRRDARPPFDRGGDVGESTAARCRVKLATGADQPCPT